MSAMQKVFVVSILTLSVFGLLAWMVDSNAALAVLSLFFGVATVLTKEIREIFGIEKTLERPAKEKGVSWRRYLALFSRIGNFSNYIEFSFLVVAAILAASVFYNGLVVAISDLTNKGFIVFSENGFFHLQVYLFGYIISSIFAVFSAIYGFSRGSSEGEVSFSGVFFASMVGFFSAIAILTVFRGGVVVANQELVSSVHGKTLPLGTAELKRATQLAASLLFAFSLALYVWVWAKIGRFAVWALRKAGRDRDAA